MNLPLFLVPYWFIILYSCLKWNCCLSLFLLLNSLIQILKLIINGSLWFGLPAVIEHARAHTHTHPHTHTHTHRYSSPHKTFGEDRGGICHDSTHQKPRGTHTHTHTHPKALFLEPLGVSSVKSFVLSWTCLTYYFCQTFIRDCCGRICLEDDIWIARQSHEGCSFNVATSNLVFRLI